jgi:hypothetical protein
MCAKKIVLTIVVAAAVLVPLSLLLKSQRELEAERQALLAATAELAALRETNAALARLQVDAEALARLKADQAELLRLRGQSTQMRGELKRLSALETQRAAAGTNAPATTAAPEPDANAPFTASFTQRVPLGQTMVTGGWSTGPGKRTLLLVTPTVTQAGGQAAQVMLHGVLVEMPEDAGAQVGMTAGTAGRDSSLKGLLTDEQRQVAMKGLEARAGVEIVSRPTILTTDGMAARIEIGSTQADGQPAPGQHSIELTPRLTPDGASVDLTLGVKLTPGAK